MISEDLLDALIEERWPGSQWSVDSIRWDEELKCEFVQVRVKPRLDYINISFTVELDTGETGR